MNQKTMLLASFVLCGLHIMPSSAVAAQEEERSRIYTLGEVVVSGTGEGVQASETIYSVSAEEIRSKGAKTLDQAIKLLPGVNVRTGGEGVPRIDIRGFKTRHVLLLLDGIPMNSAFDMQFDPTSIPTENIEQIKLTSGASSVLYGQGGLGGVINITTRKGSQGVQGMVSGETGDHQPYLARATVSGASDRFNYFLSGSASQVDGFPLSDDFRPSSEQGSGYRKNSDKKRRNLLGSIGFTPTQDLALGLTVNYSQGAFGKPASTVSDAFDPFSSAPKFVRVGDFSSVSLQLAADYAASERMSLRGWAFVNRHDEEVNRYDDGNFNSFLLDESFREQVKTSVKGITLQPRYDFGMAGAVSLSLAAQADSWDNGGLLTVRPAPGLPADFSALSAHESLSTYSAALEYEISPLPGLGLVAGYGHHRQNRSEQDEDDFTLLAGASYQLFPETRLKASFKRNVRFPSLGDLYDLSKGNPLLASERSFTYEAGVEQNLPRQSSINLTGFYTKAENLIQDDQATGRNLNLADVRFAGLEISAATQFLKHLLLRAGYAYLHSEDRSRAGRDQLQYTPGNKVTLEARYDFDWGFSPYLSLLHVGNQYLYTKDSVAQVQKAKLEEYTVVNVKLSQRVLDGKVTLYVGADNLFDENYETSYGYPQAGRFIYGGAELRI